MYLYLYQSENMDGLKNTQTRQELVAFRDRLLRKALYDYCERKNQHPEYEVLKNAPIRREPKGKPYFADEPLNSGKRLTPVHFSVSHSGDWWGCLMADEPVGFDLEVCLDKVHYEKIAGRFFTKEEHDWILSMGQEAFFEVWVRKEAFVKFLGTGLGEGLSSFTVIENGELKIKVFSEKGSDIVIRRPGFIIPCSVAEGVRAAYCCRSGDPILGTIILEM
jgi:4'-phosphopantetheinyl transferase